MTVQELIEYLKTCPPDYAVDVRGKRFWSQIWLTQRNNHLKTIFLFVEE